jgi:uncharacterized repeat protein (TIGR04076 family)
VACGDGVSSLCHPVDKEKRGNVKRRRCNMPEISKVVAKVISQKGSCDVGHKVGDEWVLGPKTPEGICIAAYHSMYANAFLLLTGASMPWGADPDVATMACPDAKNPVVFELRRIRE